MSYTTNTHRSRDTTIHKDACYSQNCEHNHYILHCETMPFKTGSEAKISIVFVIIRCTSVLNLYFEEDYRLCSVLLMGTTAWVQLQVQFSSNNIITKDLKLLYFISYIFWWIDIHLILYHHWTLESSVGERNLNGQSTQQKRLSIRSATNQAL